MREILGPLAQEPATPERNSAGQDHSRGFSSWGERLGMSHEIPLKEKHWHPRTSTLTFAKHGAWDGTLLTLSGKVSWLDPSIIFRPQQRGFVGLEELHRIVIYTHTWPASNAGMAPEWRITVHPHQKLCYVLI